MISLESLIIKEQANHVHFLEVPKSSYKFIDCLDQKRNNMKLHDNLLQVVVKNYAIIYHFPDDEKNTEFFRSESK